ncbi:hypothetical protein CEP51_005799 [Fusarium floridanum]|uniref:Uncharacterized protein n=1 Tax=Fusarium floridanum TaxID=1325733 RepID=A0A428RVL5_9HYPO|nr:hypothetical protein CEP51_005799 [Fusarium floridanum]
MLPTLISAKLWHQLRDIIWNDPSAMDRLDVSQIPSTIVEVGDILSMDCTNCALKAFTEGLSDVCNSLDVDKRPIPNHQFYAFSVVLDGESYSILPEGTVHLRPLEIPVNMREIVKEAKWQFLDQWKGMWRTWQVGEFEVRFDLYEDTKYDSTKAKIKRSAQKLHRALHRKP